MGCPTPLQPDERSISTPGGTRTRSFRVEGPASSPFRPRGHKLRRQDSNLPLAINSRASSQLDHAGMKRGTGTKRRRQQDSNLRTARTVCAVATRCLANSAMPPRAEGEGVEPPRPGGPPVFETGYRAGGSPSQSGPGRRRTCNPPLKRRQLCQLSYGAVSVTGRDRTCDAPRFRRALYRAELRSRVEDGRSRSRTGGLLRIREALCHLSYPPSGRGWARTSSLLFVRQALSRLSYSPVRQIRDKGSNLDLHVQSVASCRLDDPGAHGRPPPRAPAGQSRNATCRIARAPARCSSRPGASRAARRVA